MNKIAIFQFLSCIVEKILLFSWWETVVLKKCALRDCDFLNQKPKFYEHDEHFMFHLLLVLFRIA